MVDEGIAKGASCQRKGTFCSTRCCAITRGTTAITSERNHDLLRSLGAVPVVYGPGLLDRIRTAAPKGISAAVDLVGSDEALDTSLDLVDPRRIASITGTARRTAAGIQVLGNGPGQDAGAEFRQAARAALVDRAGRGELRVFVAGSYALDQVVEAHESGLAGQHAPGKIVLRP